MKNRFSINKVFTVFSLCLATLAGGALLSACDTNDGGGEGENETTTYTITLPADNDIYTISSDKTTAAENETVTLTVTLNSDDYSIDSVQYNNSNCTKESDTTYTFSMPASDVTISVSTTQYEEATSDSTASFRGVPNKVAKAEEGTSTYSARDRFYIDFSQTVTNPRVTITSSNESVIPTSALSYATDSGDSYVNYLYFTLSLHDVDVGVTYLTFDISSSATSYSATLVKKIEVVEYGEDLYDEDEIWTVSISVNLSSNLDSLDSDVYVQVYDPLKQYGTDIGSAQSINTSETTSLSFQYVQNREYFVSAYYYTDPSDSSSITGLNINDTINGTSAQCTGGYLTFNYDGASITITVRS